MTAFVNELFWHILLEISPFLIAGLLLAGILKVLVPDSFVRRVASRDRRAAPVLVALAGVPLPLCSCSVLPFAVSLRRQGASRGSVLSFLAATPQTGVDSITVAYGFFGLPFALFKLVVAFVSGSVLGLLLDVFGRNEACSCAHDHSHDHRPGHEHSHAPALPAGAAPGRMRQFLAGTRAVLRYAFDELLGDFAGALALGIVLSAAVTVALPAGSLAAFEPQWLYYPAVLLVSLPLYICATSSVPLAFALVSQGLPAGAALVLLIAGPATNFATLGVAMRTLGREATALYVLGIAVLAVGSGLLFDRLLPVGAGPEALPGLHFLVPVNIAVVSAIALSGLVVFHLVRRGLRKVDGWVTRRRAEVA